MLLFMACQKPYVRPEIQQEEQALGTEVRYGLANSYIAYTHSKAEADTTIYFDVKAYPISELNFTTFSSKENTEVPAADSAALIWKDGGVKFKIGEIKYDSATKTVVVPITSGCGNLLVGIYNQGKLLWSYHIWKPRVNPDSLQHYASIGADVMPINLGAEDIYTGLEKTNTTAYIDRTVGYLYQWGRKDPLGRPSIKSSTTSNKYQSTVANGKAIDWDSDIVPTSTAYAAAKQAWKIAHAEEIPDPDQLEAAAQEYVNINSGNIIRDYSMEHPTTLIYPSGLYMAFNMVGGEKQWKQQEIYKDCKTVNKYWFEIKNAYDPCPAGYMLPPAKLFRGFISASTYIVYDQGDGSNSYSVKGYEGINADAQTKSQMETFGGYNFLFYGALDSAKTSFFSAGGYRLGYSSSTPGALTDVGKRGRYLGYTSTASYIRTLYFTAGELGAQYGYNPHATANQVRCIAEMSFSGEDD